MILIEALYLCSMMNKLSGWEDTIAAVTTAPGTGAIAVIRLSGKEAFNIAAALFPSRDLLKQASHTMHVGMLSDGENAIDEVVVSLFRGPKSYTGEDVVEISCHGSPYIQQQVLEACIAKGARPARAGEFTQRAFLNGKLDLTQAEAVADLIASNTAASQKTALHNIRGGFSHQLQEMREQLIQFAALIELELDFSEEDVEFADRKKFYELISRINETTEQLIRSFKLGNVIKNGVSVAIIGRPNSGKSTLLNALLNEERAIVSNIPGTTRDTIEESLNINGILFRLIDTAGIRSHSTDSIENMGIERSRLNAEKADLVIQLLDITSAEDQHIDWLDDHKEKLIEVYNKYDGTARNTAATLSGTALKISAKDRTGIDELKAIMYERAAGGSINTENTIITNTRHLGALQQIHQCLRDIKEGLDKKLSGDLLAPDIRKCLYYLGEITGEVTNEDKLDYIFSKFCIGK